MWFNNFFSKKNKFASLANKKSLQLNYKRMTFAMLKIGFKMSLYNFKIDISHCEASYEDWYEDLPVELSDDEFQALCIAQKK